ncbi:hypothetical protein [Leptothoe kymatousa]|uniref:Uncharacterized protein n=1 Tax=Leptothoe kymatousa TAU-MAC 1615 TaxID=2364775 RepID=A0ABS5XZC3_9CYAN|nr:hypothetical protein [Leptothoe kymatousa]MBT9310726.1 hypothetical protein [Leptothoe kymatousa TAU-MAC 1615]
MNHSFLIEPGRWTLQGNWLAQDLLPITVKGKILVAWNRKDWFTMVTKLVFPNGELDDIALQYKGRLTTGNRQYTFVLQHSLLGRVEGEGWIAPESIVQQYWALQDRQMRTGFETLYRIDAHKYHFSGGIIAGHHLNSTMEAVIEQHLG